MKTTARALMRKAAIDGHPALDRNIDDLLQWALAYADAANVVEKTEARERLVLAAHSLCAATRMHLSELARQRTLRAALKETDR